MRKITARDFQKQFGKVADSLKDGEAVEVTRHGKSLGKFYKHPSRKIKCPDFMALLATHSYPVEVGDQILKEFNDSLS